MPTETTMNIVGTIIEVGSEKIRGFESNTLLTSMYLGGLGELLIYQYNKCFTNRHIRRKSDQPVQQQTQ